MKNKLTLKPNNKFYLVKPYPETSTPKEFVITQKTIFIAKNINNQTEYLNLDKKNLNELIKKQIIFTDKTKAQKAITKRLTKRLKSEIEWRQKEIQNHTEYIQISQKQLKSLTT